MQRKLLASQYVQIVSQDFMGIREVCVEHQAFADRLERRLYLLKPEVHVPKLILRTPRIRMSGHEAPDSRLCVRISARLNQRIELRHFRLVRARCEVTSN